MMLTIPKIVATRIVAWRVYDREADDSLVVIPRVAGGMIVCHNQETWTTDSSDDTLTLCRNAISAAELVRYLGESDQAKNRSVSVLCETP